MATAPQFIKNGIIGSVNLTGANTAIDGSGAITELVAGVTGGSRILEISAKCAATSAGALVNIFISRDSGVTWRLYDQLSLSAVTVSNTVTSARNVKTYTSLVLADSTHRIGVATTIAQSTNVFALGGSFA